MFPLIKKICKSISAPLLFLLLSVAWASTSLAKEDRPASPGSLPTLTSKAKTIDSKLKKKKQEVKTFSKEESNILDALDKLEYDLNAAEKEVELLKRDLRTLSTSMEKNEIAVTAVQKEIAALESYASQRLVALYKLGRIGALPYLSSAESLFDLMVRKKSLNQLWQHDETLWETLLQKKGAIEALRNTLDEQHKKHLTEAHEIESQIRILTERKKEREKFLSKVRTQKSIALASVASLKEAAADIERQILSARSAPSEVPEQENRTFDSYKGLLNMPVSGTIISSFGPYTVPPLNIPGFRSGIDIQAKRGEPIRAVNAGKALYAGWLKGYGNLIILDHGRNYCTVYAHAQELLKGKGDIVTKGEVIATVGDTGSLEGPKLHFEIRHNGKPIDPIKWLEKRSLN